MYENIVVLLKDFILSQLFYFFIICLYIAIELFETFKNPIKK